MEHRPLIFALIAGLVLPAAALRAQSIEGKVALLKPAMERAGTSRYQSGGETAMPVPEPRAAVVYLEGNFPQPARAPASPTQEMAQKNISFSPELLAVRTGTVVKFPNLDDTYHNVFSYSKVKRFDLGRYRRDEKPGVVLFDKPGVVTLHCEIHESMRGTILVLDSPYFQKTDAHGDYRLSGLPAGKYQLKAWVAENDVRTQTVELKPGQTLHVDFPAQ